MRYLHTMLRVADLDAALAFFCAGLGLVERRRRDSEAGRFTLVFLCAPDDLHRASARGELPADIELTWNWDEPEPYATGRYFGHLAYEVDDIYARCAHLEALGYPVLRPPRDGRMAFVRSPDGHSIELLQAGDPLAPVEPWASRANQGSW